MDAVIAKLKQKIPLAQGFLGSLEYVFESRTLDRIYQSHKGSSYERVIGFSEFVELITDVLINHQGVMNRYVEEADREGRDLPVGRSSLYRKLENVPFDVSRTMLLELSSRMLSLVSKKSSEFPSSLDGFDPVVIDGKRIKNVDRRLKETRDYTGGLLGAVAVVGIEARSGMVIAMNESPDGEDQEIPLAPDLFPQVRQTLANPIIWLADRQYVNRKIMSHMLERNGDAFAIRLRKGVVFKADSAISALQSNDQEGRKIVDETGQLFSTREQITVRRITLSRPDEDDIVVVSNLLDREQYSAADLLGLYRKRWKIEQVFQEVTDVFNLRHLIGCRPKALLFQFSMCLLLYNTLQLQRGYLASDGEQAIEDVSMSKLFRFAQKDLERWFFLEIPINQKVVSLSQHKMKKWLDDLYKGKWNKAYKAARDKRKRNKKETVDYRNAHTSVQRLIDRKT